MHWHEYINSGVQHESDTTDRWLVLSTMLIELYTWHLNVTRGGSSVSGKWHVNMIARLFVSLYTWYKRLWF